MRRRRRRADGGELRARAEADRVDSRRRPQRHRPWRLRRRPGDRSVGDAVRACRSEEEDDPGWWRIALGRRRSCRSPIRPGRARGNHLDDRRGRAHARWRHRAPDASVRPEHRQHPLRGHGAGGRPLRHRQSQKRTPISSGPFAEAAATSAWSRRSSSRVTPPTPTTPGRCSGNWKTRPRS